MAHLADNVYTTCFTPREYQVELFDAAKERNIIVFIGTTAAKTFLANKLINEFIYERKSDTKRYMQSVYLTSPNTAEEIGTCLRYLTNLRIEIITDINLIEDYSEFNKIQCIVLSPESFFEMLKLQYITIDNLNLLIIDECHKAINDETLKQIMLYYSKTLNRKNPRILGLAGSLFQTVDSPSSLEVSIEKLEKITFCAAETASDIVTLLRYSHKPNQLFVECHRPIKSSLEEEIANIIIEANEFLNVHRYDPSELYDEEFKEDLLKIPDPKIDPLDIFNDFLEILNNLGAWCANKAAYTFLILIEKLKVKTPYERHFLLLCMTSTVMIRIRCVCDDAFQDLSELEQITNFSSHKILRLIELLRQFKPNEPTPLSSIITTSEKTEINEVNNDILDSLKLKSEVEVFKEINEQLKSLKENIELIVDDSSAPKIMQIKNLVDTKIVNNCDNIQVNSVVNGGTTVPNQHQEFPKTRSERTRSKKSLSKPPVSPDSICGIVFVKKRITAKIIYMLLSELSRNDPELGYICAQFIVDKIADPLTDLREAEQEHKNQEEVLRKFRMHECNILVATSVIEEGIDIPKCNLVVHVDSPNTYRSYVQCKGRARMPGAYQVFMIEADKRTELLKQVSQYYEMEMMLLRKCNNTEPPESEQAEADAYTGRIAMYKPLDIPDGAYVNMENAVALVNRYCAKLPSDTFTRLTPLWNVQSVHDHMYQCVLRLPINSPVKQEITGPPMKSKVLARRITALRACRVLHEAGELDDNLQPIGKEGFRAFEPDWDDFPLDPDDEALAKDSVEPRPGTTKRRQYYYKRIAEFLTDCRPVENICLFLYHIDMVLTCPLPEEQNTRGRKIYPPEESAQGFGIVTLKQIPTLCRFPIFTRSGEVSVGLELVDSNLVLNSSQLKMMHDFVNYVFTSVLRLQKYLMKFDPDISDNSYLIIPTYKSANGQIEVDWNFLEKIDKNKNIKPHIIPEEERKDFVFDAAKYHDAVVMPWYRNQDQPQYFYVAEICQHLSPKSLFPGTDYNTFEDYYFIKYNIQIQNKEQPLLDVDHTSARLNFLTPRYVNRKGVALPTSSEETKRAKRENLEQKQILVPELCSVHPFPASLWRKAVCLPCILYRINSLLLADEIRKHVAREVALGELELKSDFKWPHLDFGWSFSDVFKKLKEEKKNQLTEPVVQEIIEDKKKTEETDVTEKVVEEIKHKETEKKSIDGSGDDTEDDSEESKDWMEIGTWSNEMAGTCAENDVSSSVIRYGSPTMRTYDDFYDWDSDDSYISDIEDSEDSQKGSNRFRIEFKSDNVAEAIEDESVETHEKKPCTEVPLDCRWKTEDDHNILEEHLDRFENAIREHEKNILTNGNFIEIETPIIINRKLEDTKKSKEIVVEQTGNLTVVEPLEKVNHNTDITFTSSENDCDTDEKENSFSFDLQPDLSDHPGPSPSVILQALTMSNANDGINLERLETIGDSFLKYAITTYLYCTYENIHEGKLSHLRSKQVSNLNLYRLGRKKILGESMIATKFEPHDNWLPPCYYVPPELDKEDVTHDEFFQVIQDCGHGIDAELVNVTTSCFIPYNLLTQHSIPDKSVADCVEALIGAYLIECGPRGALLFMAWLGIRVLPLETIASDQELPRITGSLKSVRVEDGSWKQIIYGTLKSPRSPLLRNVPDPEGELDRLLTSYDEFEKTIGYRFRDRSYLLQAMTHASYSPNRLTDCYQRLEFLGDAVLDYLITRHLYEDSRQHSPGALTDLRSALVNNTIFASLAVRYGFHKYFRHLSPGLHEVVFRFVAIQENNGHAISEEYYLTESEECEEAEDVEVPKVLGDVFESVAGAVFLDSGMSLDKVWRVYYHMMHAEIELFSMHVPKSPIRELLELEPETTKFSKPEKLADGRRVRVSVEVFGKGTFKGIGRNYRIAKCTAAKCALKQLKKRGILSRKN